MVVITVEAAMVGAICGFTIHSSLAVLGALAVPPFTAGLYRSLQGVALALSAQLTAIVVDRRSCPSTASPPTRASARSAGA